MDKFKLISKFKPTGDQPRAIQELVKRLKGGRQFSTLLGVTGSGKTFTLACAIEKINRPIIVISHNKTLASQLYAEFKEFFPHNAVEYFVSYYDYYQPESYIPQTDISYYGDTEPHVVFKVRFPSGQDTGLVAATIPLMYSQLQQYAEQFDSPYGYVTSYSSELGRNVYVFTVSEGTAANKHVIWVIAGQEPSEYWPQHIALGLIDYLISGAGATLRNEHIWKIVPSINPDGNYLGKSQRNGVGTDLTTEWGYAMTGQADAEIQGLVDKMMSLRSQGYAFDAFIDLHSLYTDDWIIFRSTSSSLFDNYYYQENLVNRIKSNTYWGMDGTIPFTSLQKTVGAIPNEFGCPTVMLEANQWRSNLIYGVPATLANLYDIGKDLGLALEGYMK